MTKVLVTGFEPNDNRINASEMVVSALQHELTTGKLKHSAELYFCILPGDTQRLGQVIEEKFAALSPDVCIGIGQARGYNKIAIERMAKNLRYFVTPDRAGNTPHGIPVVDDGAIAYWHSLRDFESIVPTLQDNGIPARVMNDCGTHLCNQAFYHCLHWKERHKSSMQVGFIHIPVLPEQVIKHWPKTPFVPLQMTCRAVSLVIDSQI